MASGRSLILAAAVALIACSESTNSDVETSSVETSSNGSLHCADVPVYLALGDSIPFGWSDTIGTSTNLPERFKGYPRFLADALDLRLLDAACPSEASGSFLSAILPDDGCRAYKAEHRLHVNYPRTQLEYALHVVRTHPHVKLVTLQLGANDLQLLAKGCAGDTTCIIAGLPSTLQDVAGHLVNAIGQLREAGYLGPFVLVGYYSPDPSEAQLIGALDQVLAEVAGYDGLGVSFVDLSSTFGTDPCDAGLIATVDGRCEIHPSRAGHLLIASLIAQALRAGP